jgi:Leucine-rich repeat (LRR) protein
MTNSNNSESKKMLLKIVASPDITAALTEYFDFITVRDEIKILVKRICSEVKTATVNETGSLIIEFKGGEKITCLPPAGRINQNVPASCAAIASKHDGIIFEPLNDLPTGFTGLDETGSLDELDEPFAELLSEMEAESINSKDFKLAMIDSQNVIAFRMDERNKNGEPALYYIDHGGGYPEPVWSDLTFCEALFILFAEKLFGERLFPTYTAVADSVKIGTRHYQTNIYELRTDFDEIEALTSDIAKFTRLKELALLTSGGLKQLPPEIGLLANLEELTVNASELEELPNEIGNLAALRELNVYKNKMKFIPASIGKLRNLEKLRIHGVFESLPEAIGDLGNLKELWIESANLASLPESISKLSNLRKFQIKYGKFETLPDSLEKLVKLETLTLVFNKNLKRLPVTIGKLQMLTELHLNGCVSLNHLPDVFADFGKIKTIQAINSGLDDEAFAAICKAESLVTLNLEGTTITRIPQAIGKLKELEVLNIKNCLITEIAEEIGLLSKLGILNADSAKLTSFPEGLLKLKRLRTLYLMADNCDFDIPESLGKSNIIHLTLGNFTFATIPEFFCRLPLQSLEIVNCRNLKHLPEDFSIWMTSLRKLHIYHSPGFRDIPEAISRCIPLYELSLIDTAADEDTLRTISSVQGLFHLKLAGHKIGSIPEELNTLNMGNFTRKDAEIGIEFDQDEYRLITDMLNVYHQEYEFEMKKSILSRIMNLQNPVIQARHYLALLLSFSFSYYGMAFMKKNTDSVYFMRESNDLAQMYLKIASGLQLPWRVLQSVLANLVMVLMVSGEVNQNGRMDKVLNLVTAAITEPDLAFNLACYYSVSKDKPMALEYIKLSLKLGKTKDTFMNDGDFRPLWGDPDFKDLLS